MTAETKKVVVVGGGPVGALAALYTARRGYQVELYDLRDDPNFGDPNARPAIALIPLALSERGIRAIESACVPGLIEEILDHSRPIYTRMVHSADEKGNLSEIPMPYGPNGECLHTLPREKIAKHLLLALQKEPNATVIFNHKLISCNLDDKVARFERVVWKEKPEKAEDKPSEDADKDKKTLLDTPKTKEINFDFIIGCDGAYSNLRQFMMRQTDVDFEQSYIDALWCDFIIPPDANGDYKMNSKNLHLWPDDESIIMAQPDFDGSFRGGMIAPSDKCHELEKHPEKFAEFFSKKYPGIIPDLMSAESVTEQFVNHQHISLKSVKCGKFGYEDSAVLLGDASHTMVPFHAMGMITGLEDVRVFFEDFIDPAHRERAEKGEADNNFCPPGVVDRYTEFRRPDVQAMTDMAVEHYDELRKGVKSKASRTKKIVEAILQKYMPSLGWATLYSRIQFGHERFTVVREKEDQQKKAIKSLIPSLFLTGGVLATALFLFASY